jgi:hypothetical protein
MSNIILETMIEEIKKSVEKVDGHVIPLSEAQKEIDKLKSSVTILAKSYNKAHGSENRYISNIEVNFDMIPNVTSRIWFVVQFASLGHRNLFTGKIPIINDRTVSYNGKHLCYFFRKSLSKAERG